MVKRRYSEYLILYKLEGGTTDPITGAYINGVKRSYYSGKANVMELSVQDKMMISTNDLNTDSIYVDLKAFLPINILSEVELQDVGDVQFYSNGVNEKVIVTAINKTSQCVYLRYQ